MSKSSKASLRKLWACRILNVILLVFPILFYIYWAYASSPTTIGAVCLTGTIVIATILLFLNLLLKLRIRCVMWILLLGIYIALGSIVPLIIMVATATVLDDLIFTPLIDHYKDEYRANRAMDKRGVADGVEA